MSRKSAFTLIELLVVVAVIAVLLAILMPTLSRARSQAKRTKCQANLRNIGHGVLIYLDDHRDEFPYAQFYGCLGYVGRSQAHMYLGSQIPEDRRPMNVYFGVEPSDIPGPQVERTRNALFECPGDRGDAWEAFHLPGKYFIEHGSSYTYASDSREIDIPSQPPTVPPFGILSCRDLRLAQVHYTAKKIVFQEPVFSPILNVQDPRSQWHYRGKAHSNLLFVDGHVDFRFPLPKFYEPANYYLAPDENEPYY